MRTIDLLSSIGIACSIVVPSGQVCTPKALLPPTYHAPVRSLISASAPLLACMEMVGYTHCKRANTLGTGKVLTLEMVALPLSSKCAIRTSPRLTFLKRMRRGHCSS